MAQFVNPPRLQSVPGLSHFHVFARRKTPGEISATEDAVRDGALKLVAAVEPEGRSAEAQP